MFSPLLKVSDIVIHPWLIAWRTWPWG